MNNWLCYHESVDFEVVYMLSRGLWPVQRVQWIRDCCWLFSILLCLSQVVVCVAGGISRDWDGTKCCSAMLFYALAVWWRSILSYVMLIATDGDEPRSIAGGRQQVSFPMEPYRAKATRGYLRKLLYANILLMQPLHVLHTQQGPFLEAVCFLISRANSVWSSYPKDSDNQTGAPRTRIPALRRCLSRLNLSSQCGVLIRHPSSQCRTLSKSIG